MAWSRGHGWLLKVTQPQLTDRIHCRTESTAILSVLTDICFLGRANRRCSDNEVGAAFKAGYMMSNFSSGAFSFWDTGPCIRFPRQGQFIRSNTSPDLHGPLSVRRTYIHTDTSLRLKAANPLESKLPTAKGLPPARRCREFSHQQPRRDAHQTSTLYHICHRCDRRENLFPKCCSGIRPSVSLYPNPTSATPIDLTQCRSCEELDL